MRQECKHFESRTYANGETVRKCNLDLAPDAPWRCPEQCPEYERRLDAGWTYGTLVAPTTPDEPPGVADGTAAARARRGRGLPQLDRRPGAAPRSRPSGARAARGLAPVLPSRPLTPRDGWLPTEFADRALSRARSADARLHSRRRARPRRAGSTSSRLAAARACAATRRCRPPTRRSGATAASASSTSTRFRPGRAHHDGRAAAPSSVVVDEARGAADARRRAARPVRTSSTRVRRRRSSSACPVASWSAEPIVVTHHASPGDGVPPCSRASSSTPARTARSPSSSGSSRADGDDSLVVPRARGRVPRRPHGCATSASTCSADSDLAARPPAGRRRARLDHAARHRRARRRLRPGAHRGPARRPGRHHPPDRAVLRRRHADARLPHAAGPRRAEDDQRPAVQGRRAGPRAQRLHRPDQDPPRTPRARWRSRPTAT